MSAPFLEDKLSVYVRVRPEDAKQFSNMAYELNINESLLFSMMANHFFDCQYLPMKQALQLKKKF